MPEFQDSKIGDLIFFSSNDAYPLVIVDPGKGMVIKNWYDLDANKVYDPQITTVQNYLHLTWGWYVEELDDHCSRFISRNRLDYGPSLKAKLLFGLLAEPVVFAMDLKMCLGIRKRAELLFKKNGETLE